MLDNGSIHPLFDKAPSTTEFKKLRKRIIKETRQAIEDFANYNGVDCYLWNF